MHDFRGWITLWKRSLARLFSAYHKSEGHSFAVRGNHVNRKAEQAAVLALAKASDGAWHKTASLLVDVGSAIRILDGGQFESQNFDNELAATLRARVSGDSLGACHGLIDALTQKGIQLVTVLDAEYPLNLRRIYNLPPFLWIDGQLTAQDHRAVAIVGTRQASTEGIRQARQLATELAKQGVTIVSGLARGIDTAVHEAALSAGGRTVAVLGHGIDTTVYPPENADLATAIKQSGALVSQFWPDLRPTRQTFPMRNVVTSGISVGTVVIEATSTSGAKLQARLALEHGKRVFLVDSLVMNQAWAQAYVKRRGATVIKSSTDVLDTLVSLSAVPTQLSFA